MPRRDDLAEHLHEAGWSYQRAADAMRRLAEAEGVPLRTGKSHLAYWVAGTWSPEPRAAQYLTQALSQRLGRTITPVDLGLPDDLPEQLLPDDLPGAIARLGRADVLGRRSFLATAAYSLTAIALPIGYHADAAARGTAAAAGARIGQAEIDTVRDLTAAFNKADEKHGGGFGRSTVAQYLGSDVAAYCRAPATEAVARRMRGRAAELAYLAGWKAHDVGDEAAAQRWYLLSFQLAEASGDPGHAAYCMRILAHQAYDLNHSTNCADLATAALTRVHGRVDPHTEAIFALTLAKAHAMSGARHDAYAALSAAERLMERASDGDERPFWAGIHGVDRGQFNNHTAKTLADLGEHGAAERAFDASIRHCYPVATMPRIHALTTAWKAVEQARQGHVEEACRTWSGALDVMAGIQSHRTLAAVKEMLGHLAAFRRRGVRAVTTLEARGRAMLAAA